MRLHLRRLELYRRVAVAVMVLLGQGCCRERSVPRQGFECECVSLH
jgi:hypothetical protein